MGHHLCTMNDLRPHAVVATPHLLRILIVEDDQCDFLRLKRILKKIPGWECEIEQATEMSAARAALHANPFDICFCDHDLGANSATAVLTYAAAQGYTLPIIVVSGSDDRSIDLEVMEAGASDYMTKDELTIRSVERVIRYTLDRHANQKRLEQLAHYDCLTGLPNREMFNRRLDSVLKDARTMPGHGVALLFVDLDRFKLVNDSLGHSAGDELLIQVGCRLSNCVRDVDLTARLGGDEFTLLLRGPHISQTADQVARRVQQTMSQPFELSEHGTLHCTASIGVRVSADGMADARVLLRDADTAMYQAKATGRGKAESFKTGMHLETVNQLRDEQYLRQAMVRGELSLVFQPIYDLSLETIVAVEALVRWNHPQRGALGPNAFFPLAHELGLSKDIALWTIEKAIRCWEMWSPSQVPPPLHLNLSQPDLISDDVIDSFITRLRTARLRPDTLNIEVEERVLQAPDAVVALRRLHEQGIHIVLDNMGSGDASLSALEQLPLSELKFGPTFINEIPDNRIRMEILRAMLRLGRSLRLSITACGIENARQQAALMEMGCARGQGFLLSRPLSPQQMSALLRVNAA
ncbi:MAG: EAL domain-containing protein [Myxococcota bacterium]